MSDNDFKPPSKNKKLKDRIVSAGTEIANVPAKEILYQHIYFCGAFFPYKNPNTTEFKSRNGNVHILINSNQILDPKTHAYRHVGIPYGAKARLITLQLNHYAVLQQQQEIYIEDSMRHFLHAMGMGMGGTTVKNLKEQIMRLANCSIQFTKVHDENRTTTFRTEIISMFDLSFGGDTAQRSIWPETIKLGTDYYNHLIKHAVPLDLRAIRAIQMNPTAIDVYTWLAMRLWKVKGKQFITWKALYDQFPTSSTRIRKFRETFSSGLKQALVVYPKAKVKLDGRGVTLFNSPPPVDPDKLLR